MKGSKGYFCNFFCKSKIIFLKKEKIYKLNKIKKKITIQEKYNWTFGSIFTYDRGGPCWGPATIQPHDQTMSFEWSRIARPVLCTCLEEKFQRTRNKDHSQRWTGCPFCTSAKKTKKTHILLSDKGHGWNQWPGSGSRCPIYLMVSPKDFTNLFPVWIHIGQVSQPLGLFYRKITEPLSCQVY